MASAVHQSLLLWAARKMTADGYILGGFEATASQAGFWNALPPPFTLHGARPDTWGIRPNNSTIAFGEAKTAHDIDTAHTRTQLRVFAFARMRGTRRRCPLYMAVPLSCIYALDRVLTDLGLVDARHVNRVHVPDALLLPQ